jgi:HNH endonuclease
VPALIAIVLIGIIMLYWVALLGTIWVWIHAIVYLIWGKFIRASLLFCAGIFLPLYTMLVGVSVILGAWQYSKRGMVTAIPAWTAPPEASGNVVPFIKATREERERVMRIQDHRCANPYCNVDLRDGIPHWDHIVPRNQGGTDSVHNMQWLCDTCNLNKKDMHWLEFLYHYSTRMGMDPNKNQKPWQTWVLTRTKNGLQCQG